METFEDGRVVSDYAKLFDAKLNGNPGVWEWVQLKMLGRVPQKVDASLAVAERAIPLGSALMSFKRWHLHVLHSRQ